MDGAQRQARVLIVDRSMGFARLLRSELIHSGFRDVALATDSAEALNLLAADRYDAVVCDNETGPLPGPLFTQTARLGATMRDPYMPIIVTSFVPTLRSISACRDAGANTFLAKPVSNAQLTEKLRRVLSEHRHFIKAKAYFGPDRRRGTRLAFLGDDRRSGMWRPRAAIPVKRLAAA